MRPEDSDELEFLKKVYSTYTVDFSKQTAKMRELAVRTFSPYLKGGTCLELGCSDGFMTQMLAQRVENLVVVDGSKEFLLQASERGLSNVTFEFGLFENYQSDTKFDYIVASYILEHVNDPVRILKNARSLLNRDGKLFIVVPNARALSRQLALHMGYIEDLKHLTENDLNHGHRRVYDRTSLNADLAAAGLTSIHEGGLMLKLLADFQMDQLFENNFLSDEHVNGLYKLGLEYPDLCGSLFNICEAIIE